MGVDLTLASVHKILGLLHSACGSIGPELSARQAAMAVAVKPIKKLVAPSPILPTRIKVLYSECLGGSRFLYGACIWDGLPQYLQDKTTTAHGQIYRAALNLGRANSAQEQIWHDEILWQADRLQFPVVMSITPLRFLFTQFAHTCSAPGPRAARQPLACPWPMAPIGSR